jgi:hypothetical protein
VAAVDGLGVEVDKGDDGHEDERHGVHGLEINQIKSITVYKII